jgi:hypothetical protein
MRNRTSTEAVSRRVFTLVRRARSLAAQRRSAETAMNRRRNDESGAILILALVFLVAVSLIVTGLLTLVGTSLTDSGTFSNDRSLEYAATDAVNLAIQNTRYSFDPYSLLDAAAPQSCLTYGSNPGYPVTVPPGAVQTYIDVYCSMVWQPDNADGYTRTITYSACVTGSSVTATTCAAAPLLQAIVAFDDNPPGSVAPSINPTKCTPISSNGSCGESMTQLSSQWNPVVPVVSSISPTSGPTTAGTTVQINGTGFVAGETVNFLQESSGAPTNPANENGYNPPVQATVVATPPSTCALPNCLQVTSPVVLTGSTYFVTVTTPGGTSAFSAVFTYNAVTPVVAGLSGSVTGGSVTGGNTVTIEGTGFWSLSAANPAQVFFCPTGGGSCTASPSNASSGVVISSGSPYESISALSPPVGPSGQGTYFLQVEVNGKYSALTGTAASGSGLSNPVFTYSVLVPIVTSVTPAPPATVANGGSITINGFNFVTGVTVGFCAVTSTSPYYSTNCVGPGEGGQSQTTNFTIVTTTQIVVTVPTTLAAGTYYPIVGLSPYTGSDQPGFPYNEPADEFIYL